jgi:hypothetical protein
VLVPWLFGEARHAAVPPTRVLAVGGMLALLRTTSGPFMLALGRPRDLMAFNAAGSRGHARCLGDSATRHYGRLLRRPRDSGADAGGIVHVLLGRVGGVRLIESWRDAAAAVVASAGLAAVALPVVDTLDTTVPAVAALAGAAVAGAGAYVSIARGFFPAAWTDLVTLWRRLGPRAGRHAAS